MKVVAVEHYANDYCLLKLSPLEGLLPEIQAGQFVQVRIDETPSVFLRRPISVNFVDSCNNELWLLVHGIGDGTRWLTSLHAGRMVNVVLPLGRGFTITPVSDAPALLVGGGVGTAPLLYLAKTLRDAGWRHVYALLGARSAADVLQRELFEHYADVCITTEDGTLGERGLVTEHSVWREVDMGKVFTCGPKPMMKAVAQKARQYGLPCEASLENMMACGLGACLCCVEDTQQGNVCVCQDGPVFNINNLKW